MVGACVSINKKNKNKNKGTKMGQIETKTKWAQQGFNMVKYSGTKI